MKGDRDVCRAAVAQDAWALQHAAVNMRSDEAVVLAGIKYWRNRKHGDKINPDASWWKDYVSEDMKVNARVRRAAFD